MNKEFVNYEQALALKELGFDEPCFSFFTEEGDLYESEGWGYTYGKNVLGNEVVAPFYQQALRWFREKYGLHSHIEFEFPNKFYTKISDMNTATGRLYSSDCVDSYREAEQALLKQLLSLKYKDI